MYTLKYLTSRNDGSITLIVIPNLETKTDAQILMEQAKNSFDGYEKSWVNYNFEIIPA